MKDIKLDTLFREKLANYSRKPPAGAWEAIDRQLAGARKKTLYIRYSAAAAIAAVVAVAGFLFLHHGGLDNAAPYRHETLTEAEPLQPAETTPPVETREEVAAKEAPANNIVEPLALAGKDQEKPDKTALSPEPLTEDPAESVQVAVLEPLAPLNPKEPATGPLDAATIPASAGVLAAETSPADESLPPITIVYARSGDDIEAKDPSGQPGLEKEKKLDKLIAIAGNIRNQGLGLAELRRAKDNLLDINLDKLDNIWTNQTN